MLTFLQAHSGIIFGILYGICELLANNSSIESNSVFQLIMSFFKSKQGS